MPSLDARNPGLRFRYATAQPPTPRGIAAFSRLVPERTPKVYACGDLMAVGGVSRELVSAVIPCSMGKVQGSSPISQCPAKVTGGIAEPFRSRNVEFPAIRNREFISVFREIQASWTRLQAAVMKPAVLLGAPQSGLDCRTNMENRQPPNQNTYTNE
jgi:hypothetical protein